MNYDASRIGFTNAKLIYGKNDQDIQVLVERTTDVLYIKTSTGLTAMLDPKTGLPLTYSIWKELYDK